MDEKSPLSASLPPPPPPTRGSIDTTPGYPVEYQVQDYSTLQVAACVDGIQVVPPPATYLPEAVIPPAYSQREQSAATVGFPLADGTRVPSRFETPWEDVSLKAGESEGGHEESRTCGLRRRTAFVLAAVTVAIIVLGVSLGVGLGLGLKKSGDSDSSPPSTGTPYVTGSQTLPAWTATATQGPGTPYSCPGQNLTLFTVGPEKKRFLFTCGRDYSERDGAVELQPGGTPLSSMAECVELCSNTVGCTACGWGAFEGVETCWMKSSIGRPNETPGWHFAVLEEV